jgi:hypothetical protein
MCDVANTFGEFISVVQLSNNMLHRRLETCKVQNDKSAKI